MNLAVHTKSGEKRKGNVFSGNIFFQPKLNINQPNDVYEQEADAVADKVMRMPDPSINNSFFKPAITSIQRKCAHCEEEEKKMQRKEINENVNAPAETENYISSLSGGKQLDTKTRNFFEPRMGYDFSNVKIHTDTAAAKSAEAVNALAYTTGNNIVFNRDQFNPETESGKRLLGHELTHVVQQQHVLNVKVQRTSFYTDVESALGLGPAYSFDAAYLVLSPLNSTDMLDTLSDIYSASTYIFESLINNVSAATGPVGINRLLAYMLGVKNALNQNNMSNAELATLSTTISSLPLNQQQAIQQFTAAHRSAVSRDLYAGAHIPTAAEQASIETVLNPGATATVSSSGAVTITLPSADPVCSNASNLEARIRAVLVPIIHNGAVAFRARRAAGPNFPIAQATSMADLAQREVENYYEPYLARASRSGAAGSYSLGGSTRASSLLRDQSTAYSRIWNTVSGRLGWLKYWYDHQTGNMNSVLHCDTSQIEAALNGMANDSALEADIGDFIDSWPAEATGGINIQPYLNASDLVCQRWDTFTTIVHEFIHIIAHPNFRRAEGVLNNAALEILKEGFDDVLRKELWEGGGSLRSRLTASSGSANRAVIEGGSYTLDMSKVCNHTYYGNLPEAERIAGAVGMNNVKLAYFLGQTEYLGLGASTSTRPGQSLTGISFYSSTDANETDIVDVLAGETRDLLLFRTNGSEIRDTSNAIVPIGTTLPSRVKIPGVRRVYVHTDDSLISIAVQNGVTPYEIMRANNLTSSTITVGTRLIIPRH